MFPFHLSVSEVHFVDGAINPMKGQDIAIEAIRILRSGD